jgi:FkbM family methyltransferase
MFDGRVVVSVIRPSSTKHGGSPPVETTTLQTPRGATATVCVRNNTSDLSIAGAFFRLWDRIDDEYQLADLHVDGVFVDIGAHIGLVTVAVLLDNPNARAICVEPLDDNCEMIRANAEANGLTDRVTIIKGAMGPGRSVDVAWDYADEDEGTYNSDNRFIGALAQQADMAMQVATVPAVSLASLVKQAGGEIAALKLDCEGCEWHALKSRSLRDVRVIFGEWHGHAIPKTSQGTERLREYLDPTHDVEVLRDLGGTGVFRAVRR